MDNEGNIVMRHYEFVIVEAANIPNRDKFLALRLFSDVSFPRHLIARLGKVNLNNPADLERISQLWNTSLDNIVRGAYETGAMQTNLLNQREYPTIKNWLTNIYIRGLDEYEDISGQGLAWLAEWLMVKNNLNSRHASEISPNLKSRFPTDLNRFRDLEHLEQIIEKPWVIKLREKIRQEAAMKRMQAQAKEYVLLDNDRFRITIPLNYGGCYMFNFGPGVPGTFCTGSSTGNQWFDRYKQEDLIIDILDKQNLESPDGKWQIHAESDQVKNAVQQPQHHVHDSQGYSRRYSNKQYFKKLFPELVELLPKLVYDQRVEIDKAIQDYYGEDVSAEKSEETLRNLFDFSLDNLSRG